MNRFEVFLGLGPRGDFPETLLRDLINGLVRDKGYGLRHYGKVAFVDCMNDEDAKALESLGGFRSGTSVMQARYERKGGNADGDVAGKAVVAEVQREGQRGFGRGGFNPNSGGGPLIMPVSGHEGHGKGKRDRSNSSTSSDSSVSSREERRRRRHKEKRDRRHRSENDDPKSSRHRETGSRSHRKSPSLSLPTSGVAGHHLAPPPIVADPLPLDMPVYVPKPIEDVIESLYRVKPLPLECIKLSDVLKGIPLKDTIEASDVPSVELFSALTKEAQAETIKSLFTHDLSLDYINLKLEKAPEVAASRLLTVFRELLVLSDDDWLGSGAYPPEGIATIPRPVVRKLDETAMLLYSMSAASNGGAHQ